ncbi:hypothetical protein Ahy_B07g088634 [Arachis hypogaea]|uniref:Uncharacterized protein n=1 Tax=Arachis hypogaea TaxID=3818 RepID=A0A444YF10_ARAHY|nr:hypothetical protein Ahy_B07g088634 [Arachis hypogaea]
MQCGSAGDGYRDVQFVLRKKQWLMGPEEDGGNRMGPKEDGGNRILVRREIRINLEKVNLLVFIVFFNCFFVVFYVKIKIDLARFEWWILKFCQAIYSVLSIYSACKYILFILSIHIQILYNININYTNIYIYLVLVKKIEKVYACMAFINYYHFYNLSFFLVALMHVHIYRYMENHVAKELEAMLKEAQPSFTTKSCCIYTSVAKLFRDVDKNTILINYNVNSLKICDDLNAFYKHPCRTKIATLRRDYFTTPWKTATSIAGILLLFLTVIQTVYSILQLLS